MSFTILPASDLRKGLHPILERLDRPVFITTRGRVKAVLLDIERYTALLDKLEDLEEQCDPDVRREAAEARELRRRGETLPLEDVLKKHGL